MSVDNQDFTIYKGEDITLRFTRDEADDITGQSTYFKAARALANPNELPSTPVSLTPTAGLYGFSLAHADTAALASGAYYWESGRNDPGSEKVWASGIMTVKPRRAT